MKRYILKIRKVKLFRENLFLKNIFNQCLESAHLFDSLDPSWNGSIKLLDAILCRWFLMNSQTFSSVFRSELEHNAVNSARRIAAL